MLYVLIEYEDMELRDDDHHPYVIDVDTFSTVEEAITAAETRAVEEYLKYLDRKITWLDYYSVWKPTPGRTLTQSSVKIPVIERGYTDISCEFYDWGIDHTPIIDQPRKHILSLQFRYGRWMRFEEVIPLFKSDMLFTDLNPEYDLRFDIYQIR